MGVPLLRALAGLAQDPLVRVPDALALVRLGLADLADVGRDLSDELAVVAADHDTGWHRHLECDSVRRVDAHGVREPDLQLDLRRPLRLGSVADAHDLELTREAVGNAG